MSSLNNPPILRVRQILTTFTPFLVNTVGALPIISQVLDYDLSDQLSASKHTTVPFGTKEFYTKCCIAFGLVVLGGVFAGLTIGLMGLDMTNLQVLSSSGTEAERKHAAKVYKLLENGKHWVLVALLLANVIVNESLPIYLDKLLGGGLSAVITSTALIVVFGEIIPQAICARYGLRIGAYCTPFVMALMYVTAIFSYPIAKLLDFMLGEHHGTMYKRGELKTFVGLHGQMLNEDEVTIITAVLELSAKTVEDVMTPISDTYILSSDTVLDQDKVDEILALGHSRIPIYEGANQQNFIGMLLVKKLISYDPDDEQKISSFPLSILPETAPDSTCLDALNYFQQGRSHILLVSTTPGVNGGAIGVVTLEDVIEEMIGEEVIDETDVYVDVHNKIKVVRHSKPQVATGKALAPLIQGIIERRRTSRHPPSLNPSRSEAAEISDSHLGVNTAAKAFAKIKVKGGGAPEKRSDLLRKSYDGADVISEDVIERVEDEEDADGEVSGAEVRGAVNERSPLLKK